MLSVLCGQLRSCFFHSALWVTLIHLLLSFQILLLLLSSLFFFTIIKFCLWTLFDSHFSEVSRGRKTKGTCSICPFVTRNSQIFFPFNPWNLNTLPGYTFENISFYQCYLSAQSEIWFCRCKFFLSVEKSSVISLLISFISLSGVIL